MQPTPQDPAALGQQLALLNTAISQLVQFTSHLSTGAMTAHVIQWAKDQPVLGDIWTKASDRTRTILSLIAAALPAAGITLTFSHPAEGSYVLAATNLTAATFGVFLWSLAQNYVAQTAYYRAAIKDRAVTGPSVPAAPVPVQPVAPVKPAGGQ